MLPTPWSRRLALLGRLPDVALRLAALLAALPADEVVRLLTLVSRLSPAAARRRLRGVRPLVGRIHG